MGLETALFAIGTASIVGKSFSEVNSADSKKQALGLEEEQQFLQYQQKTISNYHSLQKVLQAEQAEATVRGVKLSSPSLGAIARNQMNIAAKEQQNLDIEETIHQQNYDIERKNVDDTLFAKIFGNVISGAEAFATGMSKKPSYK